MGREDEDIFGPDTRMPGKAPVLAGQFRILGELGRGGMGTVYVAEDQALGGRKVAVKMPMTALARDEDAVEALRREAGTAMALSHPNIVTLRSFRESKEGVFLVMDYVEGKTLAQLLKKRKGPLPEEEILEIFEPIAKALDYAHHKKKIVHRDVKPSNILIDEDGTPRIADFGIAREMKETFTRITGKSTSGTLLYMSPEQVRGKMPGPSQDIYSLAATMYECLAGTPPFVRGPIEDQIKNEPPPPLPKDTPLTRSILRGLSKDPGDRPKSCIELVRGIQPRGRRNPWPMVLAVLVLGLIAVLYFALRGDDAPGAGKAPSPGPSAEVPMETEPPAPSPIPRLLLAEPRERVFHWNRPTLTVRGKVENADGGHVLAGGVKAGVAGDGSFSVEIPLAEGRNDPVVRYVDAGGKPHGELALAVTVDLTLPELTVDSPPEGYVTGQRSVLVKGRIEDAHPDRVLVGGEPVELAPDLTFEKVVRLAEGENSIEIRAFDKAKNGARTTRTVTRDSRAPKVTLDRLPPVVAESRVTVTGTLDEEGCRVTVNDIRARVTGKRFRCEVPLTVGENEIKAVATDRAGQQGSATASVMRDSGPPEVRLGSLPSKTSASRLRVTGTVDEMGCRVTVNGAPAKVTGLSFGCDVALTEGLNRITVVATDRAGREGKAQATVRWERKEDLGSGHRYLAATLASYQRLVAGSGWRRASPVRNSQGMLEAVHERTGLTFVVAPSGSFRMGSPEGEEGHYKDESPVHTVRVPAFLLCKTECTQGAWERGGGKNGSDSKGATLPVETVDWEDVRSWSREAGLRLPSESEWGYACRAGSTSRWCFGDSESRLKDYAWYSENSDGRTHAVAGKRPNAWGLFDMHGNVWEWCEDTWHDSYEGAPGNGTAWTTGGTPYRVFRGGSWGNTARNCRSANRYRLDPGLRWCNLGFRPAASLP